MKPIQPIQIESGVPLPRARERWRAVLVAMAPGQSFTVQSEAVRRRILRTAKYGRIAITTRKLDGEGYRIWKL